MVGGGVGSVVLSFPAIRYRQDLHASTYVCILCDHIQWNKINQQALYVIVVVCLGIDNNLWFRCATCSSNKVI